jgi:hypothetical protein
MTPTAILAMAPVERPDLLELRSGRGEFELSGASVPVADPDVEASAVDTELDLDVDIVVGAVEPAMLEKRVPPRTCAKLMTPVLLEQQSRLVPQHQRSLSARPLHGVNLACPKSSLELAPTLRHLLLVTSFSVQKLFQYLVAGISNETGVRTGRHARCGLGIVGIYPAIST